MPRMLYIKIILICNRSSHRWLTVFAFATVYVLYVTLWKYRKSPHVVYCLYKMKNEAILTAENPGSNPLLVGTYLVMVYSAQRSA